MLEILFFPGTSLTHTLAYLHLATTTTLLTLTSPRWGRANEVMSECPHLTGELVASYVNGLQNSTDDTAKEGPLLTVACCKHYAIYNVETIPSIRTEFDAVVGSRDLWETYLPVFEACVGEGHGQSVMVSKKP